MEEFFDELDENGEFTNKVVNRDDAHKSGAWHRAVVLFLVNSKKQVLMQKRSRFKKKWPSCWDVSSGGHVDAGELGLFSAIRELDEELGIKVEPKDVRYISCYRSNSKNEKTWDAHFNEFFVAFKDVGAKSIKLQEAEVEEAKWIDYEKFKQMTKAKDTSLTEKWEAYNALISYIDRYGIV